MSAPVGSLHMNLHLQAQSSLLDLVHQVQSIQPQRALPAHSSPSAVQEPAARDAVSG